MNDSELLAYSEEHVLYEIAMFFRLGKLLLSKDRLPPTDIGRSVDNALVESFVIHFRNLFDFLYFKRSKKKDVLAEDFFDAPEAWRKLRPKLSSKVKNCKDRAAKEVVHVTEVRFYGTPKGKGWPVREMLDGLKTAVESFTGSASHNKLHGKVRDFVRNVDSLLASPRRFEFRIYAAAEH